MKYQEKNDTKASAAFALIYSSGAVRAQTCICLTLELISWQPEIMTVAILFYDASIPPRGIFDDLLAIPSIQKNISSRSFYDLVFSQNFFNPPSNVSTRLVTDVFDSNTHVKLKRYT